MMQIKAGSTDVTVEVYAVDDRSGLPRTGLTHANVTAAYQRTRSGPQAIVLGPVAVAGGHVDGGFAEIDAALEPGVYRLDVPDAAWAPGADFVTIVARAANTVVAPLRGQLTTATAGDLRGEVHLCKAALVNRRVHTVSTGVDAIKDDDGVTTLVTMTPIDGGEDTIEVVPS